MKSEPDGKPESSETESDAERLGRLLQLELEQKRLAWQNAGDRYKQIRTASLLFIFLIGMGALVAFFFLMTSINERRTQQMPPDPMASP